MTGNRLGDGKRARDEGGKGRMIPNGSRPLGVTVRLRGGRYLPQPIIRAT